MQTYMKTIHIIKEALQINRENDELFNVAVAFGYLIREKIKIYLYAPSY